RLVLFWCDEKKHAIVLFLLAKTPGTEERISVGLDLVALKRIDRGHHQLNARFGFKRRKLSGDPVRYRLWNDIRVVDNRPGGRRECNGKRQRGEDEGTRKNRKHRQPKIAPAARKQPFPVPASQAHQSIKAQVRLASKFDLRWRLRGFSGCKLSHWLV